MATFKKEYPYIVDAIMTECCIYSADGRKFRTDKAMWDTGADESSILQPNCHQAKSFFNFFPN